jgi:PPOX class probable F420-dependent enzyme
MTKTTLDPKFLPLLEGRRIASLATLNDTGSPHLTAVWYLYQDDCFLVATSSRTRKARNLAARATATLMVESRKPGRERGVTVTGAVEVISGAAAKSINEMIHRRYLSEAAIANPCVGHVFAQFDDISLKLRPQVWTWWDMAELDAMVLGGSMASNPSYLLPQEI